jgi:myo-inositol catabolism protein IolC
VTRLTIGPITIRVGMGQARPRHLGTVPVAAVRAALAAAPALRAYGLTLISGSAGVDTFDTETGQRYWIGPR